MFYEDALFVYKVKIVKNIWIFSCRLLTKYSCIFSNFIEKIKMWNKINKKHQKCFTFSGFVIKNNVSTKAWKKYYNKV